MGRRRKLADWAIMHFASITSGPQQGSGTCAYKAPTKCIILRASLILRLRVYFITPRLIVLPVYTVADTGAYIRGFIDISPQKSVCIRYHVPSVYCTLFAFHQIGMFYDLDLPITATTIMCVHDR